jgi:hypothetical protein
MIVNADGIGIKDNRKPRRATVIGFTALEFKSRTGIAYPAIHCSELVWDFVTDAQETMIVTDEDLEFEHGNHQAVL